MATKEAKPDGQFWLPPEMAMRHMGPLPVQVSLVVVVVVVVSLCQGGLELLRNRTVLVEDGGQRTEDRHCEPVPGACGRGGVLVEDAAGFLRIHSLGGIVMSYRRA